MTEPDDDLGLDKALAAIAALKAAVADVGITLTVIGIETTIDKTTPEDPIYTANLDIGPITLEAQGTTPDEAATNLERLTKNATPLLDPHPPNENLEDPPPKQPPPPQAPPTP